MLLRASQNIAINYMIANWTYEITVNFEPKMSFDTITDRSNL